MSARARLLAIVVALAAVHVMALFPGPLAPYSYEEQRRDLPYAPPTPIHFVDDNGELHLRPFVYRLVEREGTYGEYVEDRSRRFAIRGFVRGASYRVLGLVPCRWHLFGVEEPARISLLGTDGLGRDVFSRVVFGAGTSLLAGVLATAVALLLGVALGAVAGFYAGWVDAVLMRGSELFMTLPWLYLLLAVRAFLPLHLSSSEAFLLIALLIGSVGWARPARLVRGVALSARERDFVRAARGFGASDPYLLWRHVVSQCWGVVLTQAALLIPSFILAEVALSFLGLGVGEPTPSWGNMLVELQQYHVLVSYWWMFSPAVTLVVVVLLYSRLAAALHTHLGLEAS
jgi:peptide/nickel transport system permease protein